MKAEDEHQRNTTPFIASNYPNKHPICGYQTFFAFGLRLFSNFRTPTMWTSSNFYNCKLYIYAATAI